MRTPILVLLAAAVCLSLLPLMAEDAPAQAPAVEAPVEETPAEETPAEDAAVEAAPADAAAPAVETPAEETPAEATPAEEEPAEDAAAEAAPADEAAVEAAPDLPGEVERLGVALEEANTLVDELRAETWTLKEKASAAEELAQAERAAAEAADTIARALQEELDQANEDLQSSRDELDATRDELDAALEAGAGEPDADALAEAEARIREEAEASVRDAEARSREALNWARQAEQWTREAEARAKAAEAAVAEHERAAAEREAEAKVFRHQIAELEQRIADLEAGREVVASKLSSWGGLRLDPKAYPEVLRKGFDGAAKQRMGSWKIADGIAAQTDPGQYFARLTFPVVQSTRPILYSFDVKAGTKGWVGMGLHFFAEGVRKPKGYGEGKSLLVWLTRDEKARGDKESYLQIYRSDDDVNMERVLDAEIQEGVAVWNHLDILYEPGAEFVVIAVNGTVRAAYRTFFGIGTGVTVSLRTLGPGVAFRNFEVRR